MAEKRFYLDKNGINDREYEFSILDEDELVDIINELNDENERLKSEKEHYKKQVDEFDGLLNKFEVIFEELEDILYMKRSRLE